MKNNLELENKILQAKLNIATHRAKWGMIGILECLRREWGSVILWHTERSKKEVEKQLKKLK